MIWFNAEVPREVRYIQKLFYPIAMVVNPIITSLRQRIIRLILKQGFYIQLGSYNTSLVPMPPSHKRQAGLKCGCVCVWGGGQLAKIVKKWLAPWDRRPPMPPVMAEWILTITWLRCQRTGMQASHRPLAIRWWSDVIGLTTIAMDEYNFDYISAHYNVHAVPMHWTIDVKEMLITCTCKISLFEKSGIVFNLLYDWRQMMSATCCSAARYIQKLYSSIAMVVNPIMT